MMTATYKHLNTFFIATTYLIECNIINCPKGEMSLIDSLLMVVEEFKHQVLIYCRN